MKKLILKLFLASCLFYSCENKELVYQLQDEAKQAQNEVIIYKNYISLLQDSIAAQKREIANIQVYKDSITNIKEELFVAKYKLERIREYNKIAADKTQLQFLRGWINRTLNN